MNTPDMNAAERAVQELLNAFHIDEGDHTCGTPPRVAKAWAERLDGYMEDPAEHLTTTFSAPSKPGLVVVRQVQVQSVCAHHLLPITGHATVAYRPRPGSRVVGLSKITRLVAGYSHRLQVQERITSQVVDAIVSKLDPMWAACAIDADHGCMTLRGVKDPCSSTLTYLDSGEPTESDRAAFWAAHTPLAHN